MPPGPHKRRAAKKKKKAKRSSSSTALHLRQGESDSDLHNSPHPADKVENMEGSSSGYESSTTDKIQIDKQPNLTTQTKIEMDEAAMAEPATVADYLSRPSESANGTPKVEDLGFKTPPTGDPLTPVGQSLVEAASKLDNDIKVQEKDDFVAAETQTPLQHSVLNEPDLPNHHLSKENEVQNSGVKSNNASPKPEENLIQEATNGKGSDFGRGNDDHVNETVTTECSERQPLLALAPPPSEKASWKNCCGLFELFSGSARN